MSGFNPSDGFGGYGVFAYALPPLPYGVKPWPQPSPVTPDDTRPPWPPLPVSLETPTNPRTFAALCLQELRLRLLGVAFKEGGGNELVLTEDLEKIAPEFIADVLAGRWPKP